MTDDLTTVERLQAELWQLRKEREAAQVEVESLRQARDEALGQQTALAEVLQVIASSPADPQRVLDAIVQTAARLCDADIAAVQEAAVDHLQVRAVYGWRQG